MPHGKASRKRNWQQATKAKAATRKAEKRAAKGAMMVSPPRPLTIPTVTEDDLLSFQFAHFGDDTKPDTFFVAPEQALNYRPDLEDLGDDGLGWYEDGVKCTLTDEQIEMFRHSELEQLKRERRLKAENEELEEEDDDDDEYEPPEVVTAEMPTPTPVSPISDGSSLEDELYTNPITADSGPPQAKLKPKKRRSQSSRSGSVYSKALLSPRSRQRKTEVPYDQRKKRKWEAYIDATDPVHGSMTHNRMLRELDQQAGDSVAMDYGDDEPAPPPQTIRPAAMPGRRIISYEDD